MLPTQDVDLETLLPPAAFKDAIYQVTGVPLERMKVMIKGGVLKVRTFCVMRVLR
jgi:ubiquitin carboxyl-terminal hydrolase 14